MFVLINIYPPNYPTTYIDTYIPAAVVIPSNKAFSLNRTLSLPRTDSLKTRIINRDCSCRWRRIANCKGFIDVTGLTFHIRYSLKV